MNREMKTRRFDEANYIETSATRDGLNELSAIKYLYSRDGMTLRE